MQFAFFLCYDQIRSELWKHHMISFPPYSKTVLFCENWKHTTDALCMCGCVWVRVCTLANFYLFFHFHLHRANFSRDQLDVVNHSAGVPALFWILKLQGWVQIRYLLPLRLCVIALRQSSHLSRLPQGSAEHLCVFPLMFNVKTKHFCAVLYFQQISSTSAAVRSRHVKAHFPAGKSNTVFLFWPTSAFTFTNTHVCFDFYIIEMD